MKKLCLALPVSVGLIGCKQTPLVPPSHYDRLADQPYIESYPLKADIGALKQELLFEGGVQAYLWALPALNMYGMKEGSEKVFGKGYNVLPIFKERLTAKTLITTPNFGPKSHGTGKNWIATVPGRGWFTQLRPYGPTKAFFEQTWKPDDIKKVQ